MKLHFDNNQEYQLDAIKAITDIFGRLLETFIKLSLFNNLLIL